MTTRWNLIVFDGTTGAYKGWWKSKSKNALKAKRQKVHERRHVRTMLLRFPDGVVPFVPNGKAMSA